MIIIQIFGVEQHLLMMLSMEHGQQVEYGYVKVFGKIFYLEMTKENLSRCYSMIDSFEY